MPSDAQDLKLPAIRGRVAWVFDQPDYDVDQIVGVKNIKIQDLDQLAAIAMADQDPDFAARTAPGDVLVAADNFGYGHPHAPPMRAMRHLGIAAVIAEGFAPTYYRGEMSLGFPQIACPGVLRLARRGDELEIDWDRHLVVNHSNGRSLPFEPPSPAECRLLALGGHLPALKAALGV